MASKKFDIDNLKKVAMKDMGVVVSDAHEAGKYCFIVDRNGNAAAFFRY